MLEEVGRWVFQAHIIYRSTILSLSQIAKITLCKSFPPRTRLVLTALRASVLVLLLLLVEQLGVVAPVPLPGDGL